MFTVTNSSSAVEAESLWLGASGTNTPIIVTAAAVNSSKLKTASLCLWKEMRPLTKTQQLDFFFMFLTTFWWQGQVFSDRLLSLVADDLCSEKHTHTHRPFVAHTAVVSRLTGLRSEQKGSGKQEVRRRWASAVRILREAVEQFGSSRFFWTKRRRCCWC